MIKYLGLNLTIGKYLMYLQRKVFLALVLSVAAGLSGCGATTSSDAMKVNIGKAFNVTGDWTGEFKDAVYGTHNIYLTLNDAGGSVTGTLAIPTHICLGFDAPDDLLHSWWLSLEGTATQMAEGTDGDNPFTSVQENSNSGSLYFKTNEYTETIMMRNVNQEKDI